MSHYELVTEEELQELSHKDQVRFALFCAEAVSHLGSNRKAQLAIDTTKLWLDGKASVKECGKAGFIAYDAAEATLDYAAAYATYATYAAAITAAAYIVDEAEAAADAAYYTLEAARYAGCADDIRHRQREYYNNLRYVNQNFEKIVLEHG